jgi:hypothetical protein
VVINGVPLFNGSDSKEREHENTKTNEGHEKECGVDADMAWIVAGKPVEVRGHPIC